MEFVPRGPQAVFFLPGQVLSVGIEALSVAAVTTYGDEARPYVSAVDSMRRAADNVSIDDAGRILPRASGALLVARFRPEFIRGFARLSVCEDFPQEGELYEFFGEWPQEVLERKRLATARPATAGHFLATAEDALTEIALSLVARLPGAVKTEDGVLWAGSLPDEDELTHWLGLQGPGAIADWNVIVIGDAQ